MLVQEMVMDILGLHREGLSCRQISRRLGVDRRTVKRYLADPSVMGHRKETVRPSALDQFKDQIQRWLDEDSGYSAMWMFNRLLPIGYTGSYERVKVHVRTIRQERSRIAYIRFETEPGAQAQVDFGEFMVTRSDGVCRKYYLFVMVLGYSRMLYAELLERCDLVSFLDAHIRAFEAFGGVPREILYDRMRNVYIRRVTGKDEFNRSLVSLATHYGFTPRVAPPYAPWVKGKVERPIQFIRESFWRGYQFSSLERSNVDLAGWVHQVAGRVHGTHQERVCDRFGRERSRLGLLPAGSFDTSYTFFRTVHKDCTVCFEANRYVAPPELVGKPVVLRVKNGTIRLFADDRLAATYAIVEGKGHISDPHGFYDRLRADREMNGRKFGAALGRGKGRAVQTISPSVPPLATLAVECRQLAAYSLIGGEVAYE